MFKRIFEKLAVRKKYKDLEFIFDNELREIIEGFSEEVYESAEKFKSCADIYKLKKDFVMARDGYFYAGQKFLRVGELSEAGDCFAKSSAMCKMNGNGDYDEQILEGRLYARVLRHEADKLCNLPEDKCWAVQQGVESR